VAVDLMLTPGQAHDLACAEPLLKGADPQALIGDKAYDADPLLDTLAARDITPVIPAKANRKTPRTCDFALYCELNLIERFFNKLNTFAPSPHDTTSSPEIFSQAFNLPALSFSSTEDRP
jgi:transposase